VQQLIIRGSQRSGGDKYLVPHIVLCLSLAWISPLPTSFAEDSSAIKGLQRDVTFTESSPLSSNTELAQRLLTPLYAMRVRQQLAQSGKELREQPIDVTREHFVVYVPAVVPPHGYALLVFVPPWNEAKVPAGWAADFDRCGMIFVSAANSGNEANIFDRREPLALLAAANIKARYPIDPERLYIGGFSGGARVALRLVLGYPDVFHGALLMSGTDAIGDAQAPLPSAALFRQFQSSRLVYMTGDEDWINLGKDIASRQSLRKWCVFDVDTEVMPKTGHEKADPASLQRAISALDKHEAVDTAKLAACRAQIENALIKDLERLEAIVTSGKLRDARTLLSEIDERYGGLAAPQSLELAERIDSAR
jgi:predicted esterase